MGLAAAAARPRGGLVERAKLAFFRSFFRLLLGFVALAEWATVAWVLRACGVAVPAVLHLLVPVGIYVLNGRLILSPAARGPLAARLVRGYVACAFTAIFCALLLAGAGLLWSAGALAAPHLPASTVEALARAHFWLTNAGIATVAGLLAWGYTAGQRQLVVSRHEVAVRGLPPGLAGLRIVHLSDLHIGRHLDLDELAAHVERVNALEPDVVCVTGDLVDHPDTCGRAFPTLAGLRARHGVLVTLGNHDVYAGAEVVTAELRRVTAFTVLRNACVRIGDEAAALAVIGVDDLGFDWARGVREHPALPPLVREVGADGPFLVLSHRPDCFPQAARLGAALVLSGHTHGGQLGLPARPRGRVRNLAEFITRFDRGLYRAGDAVLYVNRGLGFTGQRVRLFTPREIAVLELRPA